MKETKMFGKHIIIEGFKDVKVKDVNSLLGQVKNEIKDCHAQFFNARLIAGHDHLYFAVLNALKAFETGINIARNPAMETLLYVSGQHQISKAIELLGIKPGYSDIALVVIADTRSQAVKALMRISDLMHGEKCDEIIEMSEKKVGIIKTSYEIKNLEIEATLRKTDMEALTSLLVERAALLATQI